jgi:hypothetical protein
MRTLRRGIVAAALTLVFVVGVASAASAQGNPYDIPSFNGNPSAAMAAAGIPDATVGYRLNTETVAVVVPTTLDVSDETLRTIDQVIWNTEPVKFRSLEVWQSDLTRVLHRQSYAELTRSLGKRPAGLPEQSLREFGDALGGGWFLPVVSLVRTLVIAFAVVCGVVAITLIVAVVALVSAQWRHARATTPETNE